MPFDNGYAIDAQGKRKPTRCVQESSLAVCIAICAFVLYRAITQAMEE